MPLKSYNTGDLHTFLAHIYFQWRFKIGYIPALKAGCQGLCWVVKFLAN